MSDAVERVRAILNDTESHPMSLHYSDDDIRAVLARLDAAERVCKQAKSLRYLPRTDTDDGAFERVCSYIRDPDWISRDDLRALVAEVKASRSVEDGLRFAVSLAKREGKTELTIAVSILEELISRFEKGREAT